MGGMNQTGELRAALGLRMIPQAAWAQGRPEEQCAAGGQAGGAAAQIVKHCMPFICFI